MKIRSFKFKTTLAVLFIAVITLVSSVTAKAQTTDSTRTAEGRASALTEKMKTDLSLTDAEYPQVQAINLKYAQKNEEIFKGSEGKFAKFKSLKSSQKEKNKEMKAVLDKDQYKKYEAMTEEMKAKAREQYKTRQGPGQ
ncbi:MAG TPA: hypothetical protein VK518_04570 [Puia sp.]|nr:hypothetical protein [Puia sp.]